jgi:hypothetical protein
MNRTRFSQRLRSCLYAGLACCLLAGCASSQPAANKVESLEDFFGGSQANQQARFERQQRVAEDKIAKCMRAEGFAYTPYVQTSNFRIPPQPKRGEEVAFKRKNGYGFANSMGTTNQTTANENPNDKATQKMSETERNAYQKALYGFDVNQPPANGQAPPTTGCANKAYANQQNAFKPLESKFEALRRKTEADPAIAKLNTKFVGCMKKAGFDIAKEGDVYEKILGPKQQTIYEETFNPPGNTKAGSPPPTPPTIPQKKIDEFKTFELQVANADADCRPQTDINKLRDLNAAYEKAFIEENRTLLDKVKAAQG